MVKILRVSDEIHEIVKGFALEDKRTINGAAEIMIESFANDRKYEGKITQPQKNPNQLDLIDLRELDIPPVEPTVIPVEY